MRYSDIIIDYDYLGDLAIAAGKVTMMHYNSCDLKTTSKHDSSPVTIADQEASKLIEEGLAKRYPGIAIVSEENDPQQSLETATNSELYWLIDPLDGTWSYIRKRGVFTVNIALVKNGKPVFGVIYSPLHETLYYSHEQGITKQHKNVVEQFRRQPLEDKAVLDFLVSSKKPSPLITNFINKFQVCSVTPVSSSYKFCLMAENRGDVYPRFKDTCIWDTAAGHALINAIGGEIYDMNGQVLTYNRGTLINPHFVAYRQTSFKIL